MMKTKCYGPLVNRVNSVGILDYDALELAGELTVFEENALPSLLHITGRNKRWSRTMNKKFLLIMLFQCSVSSKYL